MLGLCFKSLCWMGFPNSKSIWGGGGGKLGTHRHPPQSHILCLQRSWKWSVASCRLWIKTFHVIAHSFFWQYNLDKHSNIEIHQQRESSHLCLSGCLMLSKQQCSLSLPYRASPAYRGSQHRTQLDSNQDRESRGAEEEKKLTSSCINYKGNFEEFLYP